MWDPYAKWNSIPNLRDVTASYVIMVLKQATSFPARNHTPVQIPEESHEALDGKQSSQHHLKWSKCFHRKHCFDASLQ